MDIHGPSAGGIIVQQLAEGRIGRVGQRGSMTINQQRTVPWIWSAIEFDSQGNFVSQQQDLSDVQCVYERSDSLDAAAIGAGGFRGEDQRNHIVSTSQIQ